MKAGTMRIRSKGHHPAGGIQIKNEKSKPSLKTVKNDKSEKSKYKPLWGKVFYLDLPSIVISERLEKDLKELGGRVEEFLSKDISYLISNKKEAKYAQTLRGISPVPSPESTYTGGNTSPHPSCDGSSFKTPDSVCMSRGKLLVEKAIKEHEFIPSSSILSNALSWGVKILHIDDIKYYIEQKKKELYLIKKSSTSVREVGKRLGIQKTKTGRLKKPFVKVEDSSHHYRPFYLQLSNIPLINYSIPKPCSPFDLDKRSSLQKKVQAKQRNRTGGEANEGQGPAQPRPRENKKKGYCECCSQRYEALQAHLLSEQHRNFAQSTQYQVVDDIISRLVYDFVEYNSNISRRVKCNIGSFAPIIGNTRNEPDKQLELHRVSLNDSQGNATQQVIKQDFQYQESRDLSLKVAFSSEPINSFASCSPCPYNSTSKLGEHFDSRKSYIINPVKDIKLDLVQLPLNKDIQEYSPEVSDHKGTINEKDLEELKTECCPYVLESFMHVSDFDETDKNVSQLKRKSDSTIFPDTRQKKKGTSSPHGDGSSLSLSSLSSPPEQPTGQAKIISHSHSGEEPKAVDIESTDSLPSGKLQRKVKIVLGRNKKRSQQKNVEIYLKNKAEFPATKEENHICSSPIQSLVELFQTSEDTSEFLGFTSYSENHSSRDVLEVWEEENGNSLLSMFLSSPSSSSTFTGF